jgi:hypothetical protein
MAEQSIAKELLNAVNLPVTSRVRSKVEVLGQLGRVATSDVAVQRRTCTWGAQHLCRSMTSYLNCPSEVAEAKAQPG